MEENVNQTEKEMAENEKQNHRQLTFFLEYLHIRMVVTSGHVPVNTPDIIPVLISSHLAKRHSPTFKSRVILPREDIAR